MDMKKLEFLDIYPDPISGSEKGYISISYIQHLDIYPGYISNGYISYPFLNENILTSHGPVPGVLVVSELEALFTPGAVFLG